RHATSRDDVMRGHFSGLVAQVGYDPVERLPGRHAPPMRGHVLDAVRLAVARIDAALVLVRGRLAVLNIRQVPDSHRGAIRLAGGRRTRRRDRCATAFSRQAHLGLSGRPDLAVRLKAVSLLPRLDRLHSAGADLPISVSTDDLLHSGMVKIALRLETVTGRAVYEMPVFAITPTLGPVPAIGPALTLHPFLDRAMMNVD